MRRLPESSLPFARISYDTVELTVDLSARIAEDLLNYWLREDSQFKDTWYRQRQDLADQSQDAYDLALASFGLRVKFDEQQIVDLIVHHRAIHKAKQRTRVDYFQRVVSKAAAVIAAEVPVGSPTQPTALNSEPTGSPVLPADEDADVRGAPTRELLSNRLGIPIVRIVKVTGQDPIYYIDFAEGRTEFSDIGKLFTQTCFRNNVAAVTGKLIRHSKPAQWRQVCQLFMDACTVVDGGEEMEREGAARLRLSQYLAGATFIPCVQGQSESMLRSPLVVNGIVTVCASDIQAFLNKTAGETFTIKTVVGMLCAIGATNKRYRTKPREQSRWYLPVDKFSAREYDAPVEEDDDDDF